MATLVFTAVGAALGGPIGAAIGAVVGQQVDGRLFAPRARQGPRLGDLAVQTSSYGTQLPKLFGTMRVAGTVIWATDLQETRSSSGGGKGRPKTINYSYSASFAVALSARPIIDIRRIWADGKLLRGAAGDWKSATGFRFHTGAEDQPVDPLIAAAEGLAQAPAYRGIAYALFENLQLADFGNRIPLLTFEVVADVGAVHAGAIAAELSQGLVQAGDTPAVLGYAASGDSVRGAVEALAELAPLSLAPVECGLLLGRASGAASLLPASTTGATTGRSGGRTEMSVRAGSNLPDSVTVAYYDVDRDYQSGVQRASRGGHPGRSEQRSLAAALAADGAKALAEERLASLWAARAEAVVHLPWRWSGSRPGQLVRIEGQSGRWRVRRWTLEQMVVSLQLERISSGTGDVHASAGRPVRERDRPHGPTRLLLLDLPLPGRADRPQLLAAAAGASEGWRQALLEVRFGDGAWEDAGRTAAPAVMGEAETALQIGAAVLMDRSGSVIVQLLHEGLWLEGRSDAGLAGGENLALLGDELIQFGRVEPLGNRRFRLFHLLRGRFGTEWATLDHQAGERFLLLNPAELVSIEPPLSALGAQARLLGRGIADQPIAAEATAMISGEALRPPSPVHLNARWGEGGALHLSWVRRSRAGWTWHDGSDVPLGEEFERYRVDVQGAGAARSEIVAEPRFTYSPDMQAMDGSAGPTTLKVTQLGTFAASRPATLTIDLG